MSDSMPGPLQEVIEKVQLYRAETNAKCDSAVAALNELFGDVRAVSGADLAVQGSRLIDGQTGMVASHLSRSKSGHSKSMRNELAGHRLAIYQAIPAGRNARLGTIAKTINVSIETAGSALTSLVRAGRVKRVGRGLYTRA